MISRRLEHNLKKNVCWFHPLKSRVSRKPRSIFGGIFGSPLNVLVGT